jgi:hypothetical protein
VVAQILSKTQLHEVIQSNSFKLVAENLPANLDELSLLLRTAEEYGFEIHTDKTLPVIREIFKLGKIPNDPGKKYDGALLQIKGGYSVRSEFSMKTDEGFVKGELFVFQETIANKKHRALVRKLIEEKAIALFPGCDEEYLYEAIAEVTETFIYESLRKSSPGLPIFHVHFDDDGTFTVKEMGNINNSEK